MAMKIITMKIIMCLSCFVFLLIGSTADAGTDDQQISNVSLNVDAFNPSGDQQISLTYKLVQPDKVTICIYDPDNGLVRILLDSAMRKAGKHEEVWNGHDDEGQIVPNEAYTFTIETASGVIFDPLCTISFLFRTTFSAWLRR